MDLWVQFSFSAIKRSCNRVAQTLVGFFKENEEASWLELGRMPLFPLSFNTVRFDSIKHYGLIIKNKENSTINTSLFFIFHILYILDLNY